MPSEPVLVKLNYVNLMGLGATEQMRTTLPSVWVGHKGHNLAPCCSLCGAVYLLCLPENKPLFTTVELGVLFPWWEAD